MSKVTVQQQLQALAKSTYIVFAAISIILASVLTVFLFTQTVEGWSATIVDQLSIKPEFTNESFSEDCTLLLNASGFDIEYYRGEEVTVNFYKTLPSRSGKILLLRAHSAVRDNTDWVDLFTSELFREGMYIDLASTRQISRAQMSNDNKWYFSVGPTFVTDSVSGRFDPECVIVLMGCNSLNTTTMAEALVSRGAKAVIGWTSWVSADYTDAFTWQLLNLLLAETPHTIRNAIRQLNNKIAEKPNPWNSTLVYYPKSLEVGGFKIPTNLSTSPEPGVDSLNLGIKVMEVIRLRSPGRSVTESSLLDAQRSR
ncbi:MAG: hypothetical protein JSV35_07605 [Candidatus Bathyarchaeota archaeon]|nr:MAG: hypothetical protein JSV35_07605 [Candidatus Bathyarchaeota archaeon]